LELELVRDWAYFLDLLKDDPFNWSLKLDIENLDVDIQALKKAIAV
jgi:hypothetical protein